MTKINFSKQITGTNWWSISLFYGIILIGTYWARKLPNLLHLLLEQITDIPFSFNYNHGIITLIAALLFYKFSGVNQEITLLGNNKIKSFFFPFVLFVCYSVYGMSNNHEVDKHLWALLFCLFALVYNIMEEYAWRAYLIDSLSKMNYVLKSIISGIFWSIWHLLVFSNFDQYGGFWAFFAFCILFSFMLTFAVLRTKSIIVAASVHAFIIQTNIVALICFLIFALLLLTWNKKIIEKS
jgi:membrane protease YdiL (CAAX protease family)